MKNDNFDSIKKEKKQAFLFFIYFFLFNQTMCGIHDMTQQIFTSTFLLIEMEKKKTTDANILESNNTAVPDQNLSCLSLHG